MNPSRPPLAPRAWLAAALALACSAGWPQARTTELSWTGQPRSYDVVAEPYLVTGWGAVGLNTLVAHEIGHMLGFDEEGVAAMGLE